jgi:putative transposase
VVIGFIDQHKAAWGIAPICQVLTGHGAPIGVSTYYAAKKRPCSARSLRDDELIPLIFQAWASPAKGWEVAGYRKVWHHLTRDGVKVARCTVVRLMKQLGLKGVRRDQYKVTTIPDPSVQRPSDKVERRFIADRPNRLWIVDFTYVPTWQTMAYVAFVTDVYARRIVGWAVRDRMTTEMPLEALEMAIWTRGRADEDIAGVIHHSDAGSQYTSIRYTDRLADVGAVPSIGTVGDSYDNAMAETVNGLFKAEAVKPRRPIKTVADLELLTAQWVWWWNTCRLHENLDYKTPIEVEQQYHENTALNRVAG